MKNILSLILLFLSFNATAHPLHLSLCNINIAQDSMHIAIKIFEDDFTEVLLSRTKHEVAFTPLAKETKKTIEHYLSEYFLLSIDDENIPLTVNRTERKDLAIWLYIKVPIKAPIESIYISNQVMLHWFSDQKNLLIYTYQEKEQGYQFDNRHLELEIPIKK